MSYAPRFRVGRAAVSPRGAQLSLVDMPVAEDQ